MKAQELRKMRYSELLKKAEEMKMELLKLRFQHKIQGLDNPAGIKNLKRDIARVLTVMREKELRGEKDV